MRFPMQVVKPLARFFIFFLIPSYCIVFYFLSNRQWWPFVDLNQVWQTTGCDTFHPQLKQWVQSADVIRPPPLVAEEATGSLSESITWSRNHVFDMPRTIDFVLECRNYMMQYEICSQTQQYMASGSSTSSDYNHTVIQKKFKLPSLESTDQEFKLKSALVMIPDMSKVSAFDRLSVSRRNPMGYIQPQTDEKTKPPFKWTLDSSSSSITDFYACYTGPHNTFKNLGEQWTSLFLNNQSIPRLEYKWEKLQDSYFAVLTFKESASSTSYRVLFAGPSGSHMYPWDMPVSILCIIFATVFAMFASFIPLPSLKEFRVSLQKTSKEDQDAINAVLAEEASEGTQKKGGKGSETNGDSTLIRRKTESTTGSFTNGTNSHDDGFTASTLSKGRRSKKDT